MARIVSPADFQLGSAFVDARTKGLILRQEQEKLQQQRALAPLKFQQDRLALQKQIQESQFGLQTGQAQQPAVINKATAEALINSARLLKRITSREGKISFLQQQKQEFQQARLGTRIIDNALALAQAGNFDELEIETDELIELGDQGKQGKITTKAFVNLETDEVEHLTDQEARESQDQIVPLTALKDLGLSRDDQGSLSLDFTPTDTTAGATSTKAFVNLRTKEVRNLTDQQAAESEDQVVPLTTLKNVGLIQDAQGNLSVTFTSPDKQGKITTKAFLNLETGQVENLTDQQSAESQTQVVPLTALKDLGLSRDDQGNLSLLFTPTDDPDQRQEQIANIAKQLEATFGADKAIIEATNVFDKLKIIEVSADGTKAVLIDKLAILKGDFENAVIDLKIKELVSPERVIIPPEKGLFAQALLATGPVSGIVASATNIAGLAGVTVDEIVTEARQNLIIATNELVRSLAINQRFPVGEQERIREEVGILPSFFGSGPTLIKKMRALDTSLRIRMAQGRRDAADPILPKELRDSQASNAAAIENFLDQLSVTQTIQANELQTIEDVSVFSGNQLRSIDFDIVDKLPIEVQNEINRRNKE